MTQALVASAIFLLPILMTVALVWMIFFRTPPSSDDAEHTALERYDQIIRSLITLSLASGFLLLTWVGRINAEVFSQTFGIILAFWFGSRKSQNGLSNGGPKP